LEENNFTVRKREGGEGLFAMLSAIHSFALDIK